MNVAIDFDGTYNAAPYTFDDVITTFRLAGYNPIIVTYRHEEYDPDPLLNHIAEDHKIPIYYTDGKAKGPFMEALGIKVDIWIEDNPKAVYEDSAWQHDSPELHAWREENKAKLEDQTLKVA